MYDEQIVAVRLRKRTILTPELSRARLPAFVGTRIAELAWVSRNTWFGGRSDITAGFYRVMPISLLASLRSSATFATRRNAGWGRSA